MFGLVYLTYKDNRARIIYICQIITCLSQIVIGCSAFATVGRFKDWADNDLKITFNSSEIEVEYGYGWSLFLAVGFFAWTLAIFTFSIICWSKFRNPPKEGLTAGNSA